MLLPTAALAKEFDSLLRASMESPGLHISLEEAWLFCARHPEGGRLFAQVLDIQLQVAALQAEMAVVGKTVNSDLQHSKTNPRQPLASAADFAPGMRLFEAMTSFILRYRAIWDKLMGAIVLLLDHTQYQAYCKAKSRKRFFVGFLSKHSDRWRQYAANVSETIEAFDTKFRTAEAHGSGVARRLAFEPVHDDTHPIADLFWASNALNAQLVALAEVFHRARSGH
jgi:hypothetical protein